jgi:hypothetical protein
VDVVTLKDGSIIYGEIIDMEDGMLHLKSPAAGETIKLKWAEVAKLKVTHPIPFHLKEGTILVGTAEEGEPGTMLMKAEPMQGTLTVPLDSVKSVNPLIQPPVVYSGNLQGGYSQATGNSQQRNASLIGEFVGRSESLRLTLLRRYVYRGQWRIAPSPQRPWHDQARLLRDEKILLVYFGLLRKGYLSRPKAPYGTRVRPRLSIHRQG